MHRCLSFYSIVLSEAVSELSPSASSSLPSSPPSSSSAANDLPTLGGDPEDDEGMKHLQQVLIIPNAMWVTHSHRQNTP